MFVSLHFNAAQAGKNEVEGPETYCITPVGAASSNAQGEGGGVGATTANRYENQSLLLAYRMEKALVQNLGVVDRGVRRARFAVLRDAAMPAILIEGGYMTHPGEGKRIFDAAYRKQMAAAMVKGILAYQKLTAPAVPPNTGDRDKSSGGKKSNHEKIAMSIATKTGDGGTTGLMYNRRVPKTHRARGGLRHGGRIERGAGPGARVGHG